MDDKKQTITFHSSLSNEIKEFLAYKRQIGCTYITAEFELKAFDRFCDMEENRQLTPQELADAWMKPSDNKPRYGDGFSVRQLGQYLVETDHANAFSILSNKGNVARKLFIKIGPFEKDIKDFIEHKRLLGRKYIITEYYLNAFNLFCAMNKDNFSLPQQFAEAWCNSIE